MEQNKDYLVATAILNDLLKQQQQMTDEYEQLSIVCFCIWFVLKLKWVESHTEMKRLIELHFEKCLIALAARKDYLLRDLDNKVNDNRMNEYHSSLLKLFVLFFLPLNFSIQEKLMQEAQNKLKQSIEGCKDVIKFGSHMFIANKDAAAGVWKVFCGYGCCLLSFVVVCLLFVVCCLLLFVCCLLFVVVCCFLLFVVCCCLLLFVVVCFCMFLYVVDCC
jgi:hypothetical protein